LTPGHIVALVVAALLLAGALLRRKRLGGERFVIVLVVAAGLAIYGSGVLSGVNVQKGIEDLAKALGKWTYLLVGVMAFAETGAFIGLVAPGETAMLLGGLVAGQGQINVVTLIGIVWACAVAGDMTSFFLGRRLGRTFLVRHGSKVQISEERLHHVEGFFDRHGGKAILLGRFVGLVRAIAPFLAGSSGMALRRFVPYDVVGAGLWGATFVLLGYIFWQSFSSLVDYAKKGALALGAVIVLVVGLVWLVRWVRQPENRRRGRAWFERQAERPLVRPLALVLLPVARRGAGPARFVWDRVTPGDLGLELTTIAAVAGVGTYAFVAHVASLNAGETPIGDTAALRMVERVQAGAVVDVAKVVTNLGAFPVTVALVLVAWAVLLMRREFVESLVLGVGLALTYVGVHVTKASLDRMRPPDPLVATDLSAYPSGHSAYAITWIAVAVTVSRVLPNLASRFALVVGAIVVAAVVGLPRVSLRAHWLSDVTGGWGLGAAVFSTCGLVALVVAYVRDNGRETA
jgi:membrane protein DedA with SNARE-associated domain/membrane-associated phospholipid phosphatase